MSSSVIERDAHDLAERLRGSVQGDVLEAEAMAKHTTIGLGGPADIFVRALSVGDVQAVFGMCRETWMPVCILGDGSNVLVSDRGIRGVVLQLAGEFKEIRFEDDFCIAGAAVGVSAAIAACAREGLAGLEVLYGVPGSIGGAVVMNAGTKFGCLADCLTDVCVVRGDGTTDTMPAEQLKLSYRYSILQECEEPVLVTRARMRLRREPPESIRTRIQAMSRERRKTQPVNWRSCGCMFRNPPSDSAGRLIDQAGLKGLCVGGAAVSDVHANFIVTSETATASDVRRLAQMVRQKVQETHGVCLLYEVRLMGEWPDE